MMFEQEESRYILSDYWKTLKPPLTQRIYTKEEVAEATERAFEAANNYLGAQAMLNDPRHKPTAEDLAEIEAHEALELKTFDELVSAKPCLVDFNAVYRSVDDRARTANDNVRDYTLLHEIAMSRRDASLLLSTLVNQVGVPVDLCPQKAEEDEHLRVEGTPLVTAIKYGAIDNARWLLKQGHAKVDGRLESTPKLMEHPTLVAAIENESKGAEAIHLLHEYGLTPGYNDLKLALQQQYLDSLHEKDRDKPLAIADALVECGAPLEKFTEPTVQERGGFYSFVRSMAESGKVRQLEWLLERGAKPVGPEPIVPVFGSGREPKSDGEHRIAYCAELYNEALTAAQAQWRDKLDPFMKGQASAWNPAAATVADLKDILALGLGGDYLKPMAWRGAEKHAVALIDQLPEPLQQGLDISIARQRFLAYVAPKPNVLSVVTAGAVNPPAQRAKGGES